MKKLLALTVIAMMAFSVSAMAQIDPDPDGMGIYFDLAGTLLYRASRTASIVDVYLLVTNPSYDQVAGLEVPDRGRRSRSAPVLGSSRYPDGDGDPLDIASASAPVTVGPGPVMLATRRCARPPSTAATSGQGHPGSISFPTGPGYVPIVGVKVPARFRRVT